MDQRNETEAPKRPTIADVARLSGVAPVTVSRALNTPVLVNEKTLQRVREAVDTLGYQANAAARVLAGSKWGAVGVVVPSLDHAMFPHQLSVFEAEMSARDVSLLISATNYDVASEEKIVRNLIARGVDGILLTHLQAPELISGLLKAQRIPTVLMGSHSREHIDSWAGYDDRAGMRLVVEHLLSLGHRHFAMIGDRRAVTNGEARIGAVVDRLGEAGVEMSPRYIARCGPADSEARDAFETLMAADPAPTAIICGNDWLALAAMAQAEAMGVRIPEDVSLTGFDGIDIAEHPRISLTSIRTPWRRLGKAAADLLISGIEGNEPAQALLPTELVPRNSTGETPAR